MSAEVYYFSGTGNSLAVARDIAGRINGNLIPLASVMDRENIRPEAEVLGIVFPVHNVIHDGLPFIIGRFVSKLENLGSKYVFAVCTCGGGSAATLENLGRLIKSRSGQLAAGFTVKMPMNLSPITPPEQQQQRFNSWKKRLEFIAAYVGAQRRGRLETINPLIPALLSPLFAPVKTSIVRRLQRLVDSDVPLVELLPLMDRSFSSDERCDGCGICSRVCPVGNIVMVDHQPAWRHHCENCFACLAWCPRESIHSGQMTDGERYHHPEVKLSDMLLRN